MEDRAGASVEEVVDGVEEGKSWVREMRGYIIVSVSLTTSEEALEVEVEEREVVGGWIRGARTEDECFMYARGEINGEGAKFEEGHESV
jgi:hypothetical protein